MDKGMIDLLTVLCHMGATELNFKEEPNCCDELAWKWENYKVRILAVNTNESTGYFDVSVITGDNNE